MSEQTPLVPEEQQVKAGTKQSPSGVFVRIILAVACIVGGTWGADKIVGLPLWLIDLLPYFAGILAVLILLFGNYQRLLGYFRNSLTEFAKIVWPERSYTLRMTMFVVVFASVLAIFIYGVDTIISWLFFDTLLKRG